MLLLTYVNKREVQSMSIEYAILGILSWRPSTGYELKKIFEDSSFMYWTGNNNQIYKALIKMHEKGLVISKVIHQDSSPSKKVYTITEQGKNQLKDWVKSTPEAPEIKKTFLIQLAWSDMLSNQEINELFSKYENELKIQLVMEQEKSKRALHSPNRSTRECLIWNAISENIIATYTNELDWIKKTRKKLLGNHYMEDIN
jgi:DNA-binding PadR family transcriptional regulator